MPKRLFIGGLNYRTTEENLAAYIEAVAPLAVRERTNQEGETVSNPDVRIIWDNEQNRSKGFGFAEMQDEEGAQKVINELNDQEFEGRRLKISIAEDRPRREGGFGGSGNGNRPSYGGNGGGYRDGGR